MTFNVFLLPFAGGDRYSYKVFYRYRTNNLNFIAIELPGRGLRMNEPLLHSIDDMVDDILENIQDQLHIPYVVFGHSMGGLIGYLLALRIQEKKLPAPMFLFFTGRAGPSKIFTNTGISRLPRHEFLAAIKKYSADDTIPDSKLLGLFEPVLRADVGAVENYVHRVSRPIDVPVVIAIGEEDNVSLEEAMLWQRECLRPIEILQFSGRHFFIFDHPGAIVNRLSNVFHKYRSIT